MKSLKIQIGPLFILVLLTCAFPATAQQMVQVVSQNISREFYWDKGMSLQLNAEHAEIHCSTHTENTIKLDLTIISKHKDRSTAETDLKKMKWLAEINGSKLFVRNYVELARGESSPESALKVIYNIIVPENCPVQIKDYFGSIDVKNLKAGLKIDSEYSRIELENIKGGAIIQTLFGDISCTGIGGAVSVTSNRSNITLTHISGNIEINASVAKIKLGDFDNVKKMKIKAEKSVIDLSIPDYNQFAFHVDLSDCEFIKPDKIIAEISKNAPSNIKANFQINSDKPLVSIVLNYGYLTINQ